MASGLEAYVPYKGNKFQILENIYSTLRSLNMPEIKGFVDAFTGGGSFAYFMAEKGYPVIANDLDEAIIELHKLCKDPVRKNTIYDWYRFPYTKQGFKDILHEETAKGAFVRSLWSFSNDGKTYLTSTENEQNKIEQFIMGTAEPNSRFKHIEDIILLWTRKELQLDFLCGSYEDLEIPDGYVVYADPPYAGTSKYRAGDFNHAAFYDWALSQKGLVFISEYSMPEDFFLVDEYFKWNEAGRGARGKPGVERLYCNKSVQKIALF